MPARALPRARARCRTRVVEVACGAALAIAVCAGCGCQRQPTDIPVEFERLEPGLEYAGVHVRPDSADASVGLHVLRFDPARFALEVVEARETGGPLADARAFRKARGGIAAVNAGLFDPKYRPLGLLVSGGRQLRRLRQVDHAVFTIAGHKPGMQHAHKYVAPPGLEFAIECGPRLVVGGKPLSFKQRLARRTAIAHDARGRVSLVVSGGVLRLGDLAAFLARAEVNGGLGAVDALNLDGGSSTMLDLEHPAARAAVRSPIRVPVGLVLIARAGGGATPGPASGGPRAPDASP